jgi:addiction module HigA family antidote
MARYKHAPHPGIVLLQDYLQPSEISPSALAHHIRVPAATISMLIHGKRDMTTDLAMPLARAFGTSPELWVALQHAHDLAQTPLKTHIPLLWSRTKPPPELSQ